MTPEIITLASTAAFIGFFHTLTGPDHYLPFIFMSKARKWNMRKTLLLTAACGIGHVGSSIVLGFIGITFGLAIGKLEIFEGIRGSIAAWAFIVFGLAYLIWGIWKVVKNIPHKHKHIHADGSEHLHEHTHSNDHNHVHNTKITPWILFTIFVLGPCEPLIPFLMYPAAKNSTSGLLFITALFSIVTVATMLGMVIIFSYGYNTMKLGKIEKYTHVIAGAIIFISGFAMVFLGL